MDADPLSREAVVEAVARALAAADQEDYMEDWQAYDRRARAALSALCEISGGRGRLDIIAMGLKDGATMGGPDVQRVVALLRAIGGGA